MIIWKSYDRQILSNYQIASTTIYRTKSSYSNGLKTSWHVKVLMMFSHC